VTGLLFKLRVLGSSESSSPISSSGRTLQWTRGRGFGVFDTIERETPIQASIAAARLAGPPRGATFRELGRLLLNLEENSGYKIDYIRSRHGCRNSRIWFILLVGAAGFEPATPCAQGRCATRLRYAPRITRQ
jgi:hypothetical protein